MMGFAVVGMIAAILIPKNIGQSTNSSQPTKKSSKAK
jgi:mannose/fructose/N-acetylgalactosamine-specific phosphotransferase system component IIC